MCYVWDAAAFVATGALQSLGSFSYSGAGWGLCSHRGKLVMSSGSTTLVERDPATFEVTREFTVRMPDGSAVGSLNELECTDDAIYANVWYSDTIVRIDPATGVIDQLIDTGAVLRNAAGMPPTLQCGDVLNGIAIDPDSGEMWLTGKNWPAIFSVRLVSSSGEVVPMPAPSPITPGGTVGATTAPSVSPIRASEGGSANGAAAASVRAAVPGLLLLLLLTDGALGGPLSCAAGVAYYGTCQTACNAGYVACLALAGVTAGAAGPVGWWAWLTSAPSACSAAQGACMATAAVTAAAMCAAPAP